ncbi:hypothetical protein ACFS7Z_18970 [Pontibacter toksunensis]|uniref:Outer membrane protein beta-barrel domain-containing protein n=1 Tax=Pontibacter toksunensis TaxID=1332631 RepID=A0ABW6BZF0_9BACT
MKRYYIAMGLLLLVSPAFAQLAPGRVFTGAYFGGSMKRDNPSSKTTSLSFSPVAAYVVSLHWMLGLQATGSFSKSESDLRNSLPIPSGSGYTYYTTQHTVDIKTTAVGFGPVARYYNTLSPKLAFFAEGSAGYLNTKYRMESRMGQFVDPGAGTTIGSPVSWNLSSSENSQGSLHGAFAPGLLYFATPRLGLELKANWLSYTYTDKGSEFDVDLSLAKAAIGAGFYF